MDSQKYNIKEKKVTKIIKYIYEVCFKNKVFNSVREGEGGKIWENGIETCKYHV